MVATNLLGRYFVEDKRTGRLVTSMSLTDQIKFIRQQSENSVPKLPCMSFEPATEWEKRDLVIVDHLAFSCKFSSFANLERAGAEWRKAVQLPKMPRRPNLDNVSGDERDSVLAYFASESAHRLLARVRVWCREVLSLNVSAARDKGLHGYSNSYRLLDRTGRIELGFIGLGGNNDTIYFQISGQGCRHVFSRISNTSLAWWLSSVLDVAYLTRLDLAYDDFDGNFDCDYALKAYGDGWFRREGSKGGYPKLLDCPEWKLTDKGMVKTGHIVKVGSRSSLNYWRIYDKAAEQGIADKVWFRSEVELKTVPVTALANPAKAFAGLTKFSGSLNIEHGINVRCFVERVALDMSARIRWVRQQCGRTLSDMVEYFQGDLNWCFGLLVDERGGKLGLPDAHASLLNLYLEGSPNV